MIPNNNFLKLAQWNANSIRNNVHDLYQFLNENHVDVICLSETFLNDTDIIPTHPDYKIYRLDRNTNNNNHSGGVAIIIRRSINHELISAPQTRIIESIAIEVLLTNGTKIRIFSVYLPGGANSQLIQAHYKNDLRIMMNTRMSYFIVGDLNSKHRLWNCVRANLAGNILFNEHQRQQFIIHHPDTPTYFPPQQGANPSYIDLVLSNGTHNLTDSQTHTSKSDHEIVIHTIQLNPSQQNNRRLIPLFSKTNWQLYKSTVTCFLNDNPTNETLSTSQQIDDAVEILTNAILHGQRESVPLVYPTPYALTITPHIKSLIQTRNTITRQSQRNPSMRPMLRPQINFLNKRICNEIQFISNENFNHKLSTITNDNNNRSLWQTSKFLKKRNTNIPLLKVDQQTLITPQEKCNAVADQFIKNHNNPYETNNVSFTRHVNRTVNSFMQNHTNQETESSLTNTEEVKSCIRRLKNSKAPGYDKVHNSLIKALPPTAITLFVLIINACLQLSYFPAAWKHAKVIPIRKPNKPASHPNSYRPISLLSSLSKILERIILTRLNQHLICNDIIPPEQHGFRTQFSTITQLHTLTSHIKNSLTNKLSTGLISLDIEKAFDRVWFNGLTYKLIKINTPSYLTKIIYNFLQNRSFQVHINGKSSTNRDIPYGVPQGAVLSPTLYNIYTYDIPKLQDCKVALFADDTALYTSSRYAKQIIKRLQIGVNKFHRYFKRWKIKLNNEKANAIFFTNRRTRQLPGDRKITIDGHEVEWSNTLKYLGLLYDKKITFKQHVQYVLEKTHKATRILYSLINRKSKLNFHNKILIYKVALRPVFTYGCAIFANIAKSHIQKLQVCQNKLLKTILDAPWYTRTTTIHEDTQCDTVRDTIDKIKAKFDEKITFIQDELSSTQHVN